MILEEKPAFGVLSCAPVLDDGSRLDCTVEQFLRADRTQAARCFRRFGGAGVQMCAALARTQPGTSVIAMFPVSDCRSGNVLVEQLNARGVCTEHIGRFSGRMRRNLAIEFRGGASHVIEDPHRHIAVDKDYDLQPVGRLESLLIGGRVAPAVLRTAIRLATIHRTPWGWHASGSDLGLLKQLATGISLLQLSYADAVDFTGLGPNAPPASVATALQRLTDARKVIVTHQSAGAVGKDGAGPPVFCPAAKSSSPMVTGLDDRLFALVGRGVLMMDGDLSEALRWASANLIAEAA